MGLAATLLIVAGFFAYAHWGKTDPSASARTDDRPKSGSAPVIAVVYECKTAAGREFSDKPCAKDALLRKIVAPNRMPSASGSKQDPRH